jgi:predicted amidohydrolase
MPANDRKISVLMIQMGPCSLDKEKNIQIMLDLFHEGMAKYHPQFAVFPELSTTPYFAGKFDQSFFSWAEPIPGPTTRRFAEEAKEHSCYIVLPIFERGNVNGEFYNAVTLLNPDQGLTKGTLLTRGSTVDRYRKCHVPCGMLTAGTDEKVYFRPGQGFVKFSTPVAELGCLICYDRSFPEAWRVLALSGVEIVFVPTASAPKNRKDSFIMELRTAALQNGLFVVACNKGGLEELGGKTFFGQSCAINPFGDVIAEGPADEGPAFISVLLDMSELERYATSYHYFRDRRTELYETIIKAD